jgi:DNA-binding transcriptional regulator WhiA
LKKDNFNNKKILSYIIGVSLGDGNLSNPNGRATRLRITCDKKYPKLIEDIKENIQIVLPENKVSIVNKRNAVDISCYSNKWEKYLGWKAKGGSKIKQKVEVPIWIKNDTKYIKECLRGLFQTDGSIYNDRGYIMVNYTSANYTLVKDTEKMLEKIGFRATIRKVISKDGNIKYVIRISKNVKNFIKIINLWKG